MWFDTHSHFLSAERAPDFDTLGPQLEQSKIVGLIDLPLAMEQWSERIAAAQAYRPTKIYTGLGFHPLYLPNVPLSQAMDQLAKTVGAHPKQVIVLGELGLDFVQGAHSAVEQLPWLNAQLALAVDLDLPVTLHVRKAHPVLLAQLKKYPKLRGVVHGFSGAPELAQAYLGCGLKLGLGGQLTYPNARRLRATALHCDLSAFVLESDSPWMPPSGYNLPHNTPLSLLAVAQTLATLRGIEIHALADVLWATTQEVFFA
jgi:TatD DNase family protein